MLTKINSMQILKWTIYVFFACSFALLSFYQLVYYQKWFIIFTVLFSFLFFLYFLRKTGKQNWEYIKSHRTISGMLLLLSILLVLAMYQEKGVPNLDLKFFPLPFHFFRLRWWVLATPAIFYLLVWILQKIKSFSTELWESLEQSEKRFYKIATLATFGIVFILYAINAQWYMQYDIVYSMDSGWVLTDFFPNFFYDDIRHPVLSVITFPMWALIRYVLQLFVPSQLLDMLTAFCIQMINIQFLLVIGLLIGKLSKSKWVSLLYFGSAPVLLFTVFFEKYQLCTFLLVLYAYQVCKKGRNTGPNLMLATGAMPTSIFLAVDELFIREPVLSKLKRFGIIAIQGIAFLICTGRIHLVNPSTLLKEVSDMANIFGGQEVSTQECLFSFIKMVHGSFLGMSSTTDSAYLWTDIMGSLSVFGVIILVVILVGVIVNWKDHFVRICTIWTSCSFLLFIVFHWSVHESPLFSIYFSWAMIPLFQKGIQFIIQKLHWKEKVVYSAILIPMAVVNVLTVIDIGVFLK